MADEHAKGASEPLTRPHLAKQTLASRDGRNTALSPNAPISLDMHSASSPLSSFGDGSGSSSSKQHFSFSNVVSTSTFSGPQSPDAELEASTKPGQSPRFAYFQFAKPDTDSHTPASLLSRELSELSQISASPPSGTSESEDDGGPTRASIRAWAKATPAGAPTSLSTRSIPEPPHSGLDEYFNRLSLTQTMRDLPTSAESSVKRPSSRSRDISLRRSFEREENSGNVADGESSGSEQNSSSPPIGRPSPDNLKLAAQRELIAPHPHPRPASPPKPTGHAHTDARQHATAHPPVHSHSHAPHVHFHPQAHSRVVPHSRTRPESSLPVPVPASAPTPTHPDQQERAERRHRHKRRRHRDRERDREHDRDRRTRHPPGHGVVSMPALQPLPPLRPPPRPIPMGTLPAMPLRTISVPHSPASNASSRPKTDVFGEIEKMLRKARKPILRVREVDENENDAENDVLENIRAMFQRSCR
ncbi:hypothetical protein VTO73DRAFT_1712 [Trametes versicolor]